MELVNECICQHLLCTTFKDRGEPSVQEPDVTLNEDEENIIRYACGYIGMKLHRKYMKIEGEKAARFVECLDRMKVDDQTPELPPFLKLYYPIRRSNKLIEEDYSKSMMMLITCFMR